MGCRESENSAGLSDCLYPRDGGEAGKGIGGGAGGGCFGAGSFLARRARTKNKESDSSSTIYKIVVNIRGKIIFVKYPILIDIYCKRISLIGERSRFLIKPRIKFGLSLQ